MGIPLKSSATHITSNSPYRYGNFRIDKIIAVLDPDADIEFEQRKK